MTKTNITKINILFILFVFIFTTENLHSQIDEIWKKNIDKSDEFLSKKDYKNALDFAFKSLADVKKTFGEKNESLKRTEK